MTVKLRVKRDGWWEFAQAVKAHEDFDASALIGRNATTVDRWGRLPHSNPTFYDELRSAEDAGVLRYVVSSYWTPIAFAFEVDGEWHWLLNEHRYSVTTSAHQSKIFTAITSLEQ
jgi:hypothetical protein